MDRRGAIRGPRSARRESGRSLRPGPFVWQERDPDWEYGGPDRLLDSALAAHMRISKLLDPWSGVFARHGTRQLSWRRGVWANG